jgi:hypothetical protein
LQDYKDAFYSELDAFKERIKKRAQEKIEEALEEERRERLGPGGLDPAEVSSPKHEAVNRTEGPVCIHFCMAESKFQVALILKKRLLKRSFRHFEK